jgi:hypothetical protein
MRPGRNGRVVPTPRHTDLLRQTLDINGFPHVEVVSNAPFEADGRTLQLVVPERRSLNAASLRRSRRAKRRLPWRR